MKPLQIDFAPRRGWWDVGADKRSRPLWWLSCAALLIVLCACLASAWSIGQERARASAKLASLQATVSAEESGGEERDPVNIESAEAFAQASQHLNYPWPTLLTSLEHSVTPEVSVVSVELGISRPSNKVVIETADVATALNYLDSLKTAPGFQNLALTRQESVSGDGGQQRIRFTLEAPQAQAAQKSSRSGATR